MLIYFDNAELKGNGDAGVIKKDQTNFFKKIYRVIRNNINNKVFLTFEFVD